MTRIPRLAWLAYFVSVSVLWSAACARSTLPSALTDREFWELITTLSEQPGRFPLSDNFVSNEPRVSENARWLRPSGGVYIGVGPEQNFSYIARLQPTMAFIVDIRRENRDLQLLYKALFELSADRVDFVARLFSRPRPAGLGPSASVEEVFRRYEGVTPSRKDYEKNAALIRQQLVRVHGFPLSDPELEAIDRALNAFYAEGPEIQFWGARSVDARRPSYRQLMTAKDLMGESRSFLATEGAFTLVKELQSRNRIVPVVGDFGGAHAIRRVGGYVRDHADAITGFYASNVAVYLTNEQARAFCGSLASLPAARGAFFIESDAVRPLTAKLTACAGSPRQLGARCDLRALGVRSVGLFARPAPSTRKDSPKPVEKTLPSYFFGESKDRGRNNHLFADAVQRARCAMTLRHKLLVACAIALTVIAGAAIGHAQVAKNPYSVVPVVLSGSDIGFRVEGRRNGKVTGRLVVRVDGDWVDAESSFASRPLTMR